MKLKEILDWEVEEKKLYLEDGTEISEGKALVRSDNNSVIEVVSSGYRPFKNEDLIDLITAVAEKENLTDSDIEIIETRDGQKINAIIDLNFNLKVKDDIVGNRIVIQNSHGGYSSLKFGFGNLVLSCTNGLIVFKEHVKYTINHNKYLNYGTKQLFNNVENIKHEIKLFNDFSNFIAENPIEDREKLIIDAINHVTNVDLSISREQFLEKFRFNKYRNLKWETAEKIKYAIHREMNAKGDNYWGLLNGFTYYTSHMADTENKDAFLLDGYGKIITDKAIRFIKKQLVINDY
jgi:hypothetical protein